MFWLWNFNFCFGCETFKASTCFFLYLQLLFPKAFSEGQYVNWAFSIILLWSEVNISSPVRYPYISSLPDDNVNIFGAFLLISYCSFSFLISSSITMASFYDLPQTLKIIECKNSINHYNRIWFSKTFFCKYLMNGKCDLLKLSFIQSFHNKI